MAELVCLLGLNSEKNCTGHLSTSEGKEFVVSCIGKSLVLQELDDRHDQIFLRGHASQICALATGSKYIASGEVGSKSSDESPIWIWDAESLEKKLILTGLHSRVLVLQFSPDGKRVLAIDSHGKLIFWDLEYGEIVIAAHIEGEVFDFCWVPTPQESRHPTYRFCVSFDFKIEMWVLEFDLRLNQYRITKVPMVKGPKSFARRNFSRLAAFPDCIVAGSASNELFLFTLPKLLLKRTIPGVCRHRVEALLPINDDSVLVGSGDGTLSRFLIRHNDLYLQDEIRLKFPIVSLAPAYSDNLYCLTKQNELLLINQDNLTDQRHITGGENGELIDVRFFGNSNEHIITLSRSGALSIHSLEDYSLSVRFEIQESCTCMYAEEDSRIICVGCDSGTFHVFQFTNAELKKLWRVSSAHKQGVTAIFLAEKFLITGGGDGAVRFWSKQSQSFRFQPPAFHSRAVRDIAVDCQKPHLFHFCSDDRTIVTYNMKSEKVKDRKQILNGCFFGISQRRKEDYELVSVVSDGRTLVWDCDYVDPVKSVSDPEKLSLNAVDVSPCGQFAVIGGESALIYVLNLSTMEALSTCVAHSSPVQKVRWTPDGKQFVAVSQDSSISIWNWYADLAVAELGEKH